MQEARETERNGKQRMSKSRLRQLTACQRLHYYEYELGYRPKDVSEALLFGRIFHIGQEAYWKEWLRGQNRWHEECLDASLDAIGAAKAVKATHKIWARELMAGYHFRWKADPIRVVHIEKRFETPLVNPVTGANSQIWVMVGYLDLVVEKPNKTGTWVLMNVEHKTASDELEYGSVFWQKLRMDPEVAFYEHGSRALGIEIDETLYDVVKKPTIRLLKATPVDKRKYKKDGSLYANQREESESLGACAERLRGKIAEDPNKYYARGTVIRLEAEMKAHMFSVWQLAKQAREAQRAGFYPFNHNACNRFNTVCPFIDVCCGDADITDPTKFVKVHGRLDNEESNFISFS